MNHTFYHGTAYSPQEAQWPGWLFYASSQLNPHRISIWRDFSALNEYVTRCQSILQHTEPDNDVLLYWPIHDTWHNPSGLRMETRVHNAEDWFYGHPLGNAAEMLQENGYAFDYVSDRGLTSCKADKRGHVKAPGGNYEMIVIPKAHLLPLSTLLKLNELANSNVKVIFWGGLPDSEPGIKGAKQSQEWKSALSQLRTQIANGNVVISDDLLAALHDANLRTEQNLCKSGISFLRKRWHGDTVYFLQNSSDRSFDDWTAISASCENTVLLSPYSGRIGKPETRTSQGQEIEFRLQLAPGETVFLRVCTSDPDVKSWQYLETAGTSTELSGPWHTEFISGGPTIPASFETAKPVSWTQAPDKEAERFAGTVRYSTTFSINKVEPMLLDLGKVLGSARVTLNGEPTATLISAPYTVVLKNLRKDNNQLQVEVTGLAANRIRDLDRRKVNWRVFEDINFVNIRYRRFDASDWPVRDMGLLGPVKFSSLAPSK